MGLFDIGNMATWKGEEKEINSEGNGGKERRLIEDEMGGRSYTIKCVGLELMSPTHLLYWFISLKACIGGISALNGNGLLKHFNWLNCGLINNVTRTLHFTKFWQFGHMYTTQYLDTHIPWLGMQLIEKNRKLGYVCIRRRERSEMKSIWKWSTRKE